MKYLKYILFSCMVAVACIWSCDAEAKKKQVVDIYELTLDDNIVTPEIDNEKIADRIEDFQYEVAVKLKKHNLDVELMRDNQVVIITIPASKLFAPNDTTLSEVGKVTLKPILPFVSKPGLYKMLLVMHSDNTGSDSYTMNLTRSRVNSVFDWMADNGSVDFVVPYALGGTDPAVDNNSVENRKKNRRLEIFLVPEEAMLALAKKNKIGMNILNLK